jgi:hypothetical protein
MLAALARNRATALAAEIIFDGTKLPIEASRPKTTSNGINCSFQLYSITQNRAGTRRTGDRQYLIG